MRLYRVGELKAEKENSVSYATNLIRSIICTCLLAFPQPLASASTDLSREGDISPRDVRLYQKADGTINIVIGRLSLRVDSAMYTTAGLVTDSGLVSPMIDDRARRASLPQQPNSPWTPDTPIPWSPSYLPTVREDSFKCGQLQKRLLEGGSESP